MFQLLAIVLTGIISYFLPIIMWDSSWIEIIKILKGVYDDDVIGSLNIIKKYGIQNNYYEFFREKLITLIVLTFAILIVLITICTEIEKQTKQNKTNE